MGYRILRDMKVVEVNRITCDANSHNELKQGDMPIKCTAVNSLVWKTIQVSYTVAVFRVMYVKAVSKVCGGDIRLSMHTQRDLHKTSEVLPTSGYNGQSGMPRLMAIFGHRVRREKVESSSGIVEPSTHDAERNK